MLNLLQLPQIIYTLLIGKMKIGTLIAFNGYIFKIQFNQTITKFRISTLYYRFNQYCRFMLEACKNE